MTAGKATTGPPFDFAQGRLFGDDNKKSNGGGFRERQMSIAED
jgi:hypothetical protein